MRRLYRILPLEFGVVAVFVVVVTVGCGRLGEFANDTNSLERRGPDPNSPASPYDLQPFGNPSNACPEPIPVLDEALSFEALPDAWPPASRRSLWRAMLP